MVAEVAQATARTPRAVYREESIRTLFVSWFCFENARMRPIQYLLDAVLPSGPSAPAPGVLPGGRADGLSEAARRALEAAARGKPSSSPPLTPEAARAAAWAAKVAARPRPKRGGEVRGHTLVVDIDDPGAFAAYAGTHPGLNRIAAAQGARLPGPGRRG